MFVDRLDPGGRYLGVTALAYDACMPPGTVFDDDHVHLETLRRAGGTGLELGVGNGRFLLAALDQGLTVEGIDHSPDMLERCRHHLAIRRMHAELHQGEFAPLALGRTYDSIVATAGSFSLVTDPVLAAASLRSCHDHLVPGGALSISMFTSDGRGTTRFVWRLRRTGTDDATGLTYVTHESTGLDPAPQTILTYNRIETYDPDGELVATRLNKLRLRWWQQDELVDAVRTAGFEAVRVFGGSDGWVLTARRA